MEAVGDAFVPESAADVLIVLAEGILAADNKNDVHPSQGFERAGITQVGKKMRGTVEVDVLIVIPAEEILKALHLQGEIVAPREGAELAEEMGMTKGDVRGMVGPKGEAMGNGALVAVLPGHQGHHFVKDVVLVLDVAADAFVWRYPAGVEALSRVTVHAVELKLTPADFFGDSMMHAEVLILAEVAVPRGEDEHFGPGVTDDKQAHVAFDTVAVPAMVFEVHGIGPK